MQYKTITLGLIQEQPELYERLRSGKRLLTAMDAYATELKASHEAWKERITRANPHSDPGQVASQALELAIQAMRERFGYESPANADDPLSLDAAMNFLRKHTPPA